VDNIERNQKIAWVLGGVGGAMGVWLDYQLWASLPAGTHMRVPIFVILILPAAGAFIGLLLTYIIVRLLDLAQGNRGESRLGAAETYSRPMPPASPPVDQLLVRSRILGRQYASEVVEYGVDGLEVIKWQLGVEFGESAVAARWGLLEKAVRQEAAEAEAL